MKGLKFAMDDLVKVEDLNQYFLGTVVLYKEKPVKVKAISQKKSFRMLDLFTQRTFTDDEALKYITPPMRRMGMINVCGSVVYCQRRPIRVYQMGVNKNNLRFTMLDVPYQENVATTQSTAMKADTVEFADMLFDKYPSFAECIKYVREFDGAMAFDKQFAVDSRRGVWYKEQLVGRVSSKSKTVEDISWDPGHEHLILLLKGNYEKDSRTVWKTAPQR